MLKKWLVYWFEKLCAVCGKYLSKSFILPFILFIISVFCKLSPVNPVVSNPSFCLRYNVEETINNKTKKIASKIKSH